jgi:drug/metabolite transporter (DMT)-like permease
MNPHQSSSPEKSAFAGTRNVSDQAVLMSGALPFILGNLLLGTIGVFVHEANAHPLTVTWFRCAFGLLGLTVWMLLRGQMRRVCLPRRAWAQVLVAGALMVVSWTLFFAAIERTSAGVATVLFHIQPMWVLLLGAWWLKEPIARQRIASVMAAMLGLLLATGILEHLAWPGTALEAPFQPDYWIGVALCVAGAFCTACVTIIAKRLRDMPAGTLAWWQCAVGTLSLAAWPMVNGWPDQGASWAWLSGLGLIHTGLAYSLMYAGMARLHTDRIAVFQFIYPAAAILIDWLIYGQSLGKLQLVGVALMSAAICFAERAPRRRP